jgi:hypothetical protein
METNPFKHFILYKNNEISIKPRKPRENAKSGETSINIIITLRKVDTLYILQANSLFYFCLIVELVLPY